MMTFLPFPEFDKSAQCLDNKRLGCQRIEAWQIYQTLKYRTDYYCPLCKGEIVNIDDICSCRKENEYDIPNKRVAWKNHPIVRMWKGYEKALLLYGIYVCGEWKRRGYKDTMYDRFSQEFGNFESKFPEMHGENQFPMWLGYEPFHKSHRAKLYSKSPNDYQSFIFDYLDLEKENGSKEPKYLWYKQIRITRNQSNIGMD